MAKYKVHIFKSSNNFTINSLTGNVTADKMEYLVVAGGGGGGYNTGGGGGAGGVLSANSNIIATTYTVTVGAGGSGSLTDQFVQGFNGSNSLISGSGFTTVNSVGGGGGGSDQNKSGKPGGSGGGNSINGGTGGSGIPGQGNPGGTDDAAGGGGAGDAGSGTRGGNGIYSTISGSNVAYGGGGGGWGRSSLEPGGLGGGGAGNLNNSPTPAVNGTVNTGGGGGGGAEAADPAPAAGADGGSGIVIIRYPKIEKMVNSRVSIITSTTSDSNTILNNSNITFTINTRNAANGEVLYYSTLAQGNGTINSNAFVSGNTGSFIVNGNVGSFTLVRTLELYNDTFKMQIRRTSSTGPILGDSNSVSVVTTQMIGGTSFIQGSDVFHVFTTTGNLTVLSNVQANILVVAGGGAGGAGGGGGTCQQGAGGGGGAGGLVLVPLRNVSVGSYVIEVGAGGSSQARGSNTSAFGLIALGGGRGVATTNPAEYAGGSAAGAGWVSFGTAGQIVAGGTGTQTTSLAIPADSRTFGYGGNGGSARDNTSVNGGGGGAGGNGANHLTGTGGLGLGVPWVPSNYGQTGPVPGVRYFSYGGGSASTVTGGASTGQGGGGGPGCGAPYAGGSGVVIVRYRLPN